MHANLAEHIRKQHPGEARGESLVKKLIDPRPRSCPYCNQQFDLNKLESHIRDRHPVEVRQAEERVRAQAAKEEAEKQRKLEEIARQYGAVIAEDHEFDDNAPYEWKVTQPKHAPMQPPPIAAGKQEPGSKSAEKDPPKPDQRSTSEQKANALRKQAEFDIASQLVSPISGWVICTICTHWMKEANVLRHFKTYHPAYLKGTADQVTSTDLQKSKSRGPEVVACPTCGKPCFKEKLAEHLKTHQG